MRQARQTPRACAPHACPAGPPGPWAAVRVALLVIPAHSSWLRLGRAACKSKRSRCVTPRGSLCVSGPIMVRTPNGARYLPARGPHHFWACLSLWEESQRWSPLGARHGRPRACAEGERVRSPRIPLSLGRPIPLVGHSLRGLCLVLLFLIHHRPGRQSQTSGVSPGSRSSPVRSS